MSGGFADLGLLPELLAAVEEMGWHLPTDIQDESIPLILGGGDMMGAAETGSGKTAAFGLPVIQLVHERLREANLGSSSRRKRKMSTSEVTVHLNEDDRDVDLVLVPDFYSCSHTDGSQWVGIRATHGVQSGKFFYEASVKRPGNCRVGWSTMAAHLELGKDAQGFGYGGKGWKSFAGAYEKYGGEYTAGDVIGCFLDIPGKCLVFSKNGVMLDKAYDIPEELAGSVFFPAIALQNSEVDVNFGQRPFQYFDMNCGFRAVMSATSSELFDSDSTETYIVKGRRSPLAIILEPTRDLAEQVYDQLRQLCRHLNEPSLNILLLIGEDRTNLKQAFRQGVDIIVGTIGKIQGCISSGQLDLSSIRHFILDEADKLLSTENFDSIKQIYSHCPGGGIGANRLQVCFFSATLHSPAIRQLAETICQNPIWVDLKGRDLVPNHLHHVVYPIDIAVLEQLEAFFRAELGQVITDGIHGEDLRSVTLPSGLGTEDATSLRVKRIKPLLVKHLIDVFEMPQCMIFCRTNLDCINLAAFFSACGAAPGQKNSQVQRYPSKVLGSAMSQEERRQALSLFKAQEIRLLICTDLAARGIDVDALPYVINLTMPEEAEHYLHRIGRVGRRQRAGLAISLANMIVPEKVWFHTCKTRGGQLSNHRYQCTSRTVCCANYDEEVLLAKVEKHLGTSVPRMDTATFSLPEEITSKGLKYGEAAGEDTSGPDVAVYMTEKVRGQLKTLVDLETQAQNLYLSMQFGKW